MSARKFPIDKFVAVGAGVLRFTPDQVRSMSLAEFNLAVDAYSASQGGGGSGADLSDDDIGQLLDFLEEHRDWDET